MCAKHKKFFTDELLKWKNDIIKANNLGNILNSSDDNVSSADIIDQPSSYTDKSVEMKALNRSRKLISKINSALQRLKDGTYGFCEETGEPIGLKRLIARPIATLTIEAQERHEKNEKIRKCRRLVDPLRCLKKTSTQKPERRNKNLSGFF